MNDENLAPYKPHTWPLPVLLLLVVLMLPLLPLLVLLSPGQGRRWLVGEILIGVVLGAVLL